MSKVIRKISIGSDYKNEAMHYSIGQEVYGGHIIGDILYKEVLEAEYGAINISVEDGTYTEIETDVEGNKED